MSLFSDNNADHGNNNRMLVHSSEQVNAEQLPKRGFFINVQPVARQSIFPSEDEQWQQPPAPSTLLALTRRGNNLNISPGEAKRESFTKTTAMKRVRIEE
jgi:hypothetical protein